MLPRSSALLWLQEGDQDEAPISWPPPSTDYDHLNDSSFTALLDSGYNANQNPFYPPEFIFNSPLPSIQMRSFLSPKSMLPCYFNFDNAFDFTSCDPALFPTHHSTPFDANTAYTTHLQPTSDMLPFYQDIPNAFPFECFDATSLFPNKVLRPLQLGAHPTLFQRRQNLGNLTSKSDEGLADTVGMELGTRKSEVEVEDTVNYDSDEKLEEDTGGGVADILNASSSIKIGDDKGKRRGMPAKNLMAERRRRKKLNDRLYMLRSVVPKISKMDRASILGDAIDYLKELLQRINDLHNELESTPPGSMMQPTCTFHPLKPTPPTLPCHRVKEELRARSTRSPKSQSARVEVRLREGRGVNIHMLCARRPGLLLSTMKALDGLGLDIQQAVISCFNGFALDVFGAECCREGEDVLPEQIKAMLVETAGFHGVM